MKKMVSITMVLLTFFLTNSNVVSQTRERSEIPVEYTWDLTDLYDTDEAWTDVKNVLVTQFDNILKFKGEISKSPYNLLSCLKLDSKIKKELGRLRSYAGMKFDQNTRSSKYLAMKQEISQLYTDYNSKSSFINPEILKMDIKKIDEFILNESRLKDYKFYLYDLQRSKKHLLSEKEEKIIAETGLMAGTPYSIYSIFSNAELPFPEIELSDGSKALLNQSGYTKYRTLTNRKDREAVFQTFFGKLNEFKRTFGTNLDANVKKDMFYARVRGYNNSLESALDANNIPVEVYYSLIKNVNDNLESFHRYLKIKKRMLGVEQLKYSDLYAPVVKELDIEYTIDEAKEMVSSALKPLGKKYIKVINKALNDRWIDVYPTPGKRSGAYSNGSAYDVHPYILLNFNGTYNDVSTLAHELGHTMHSYYSNNKQPYPTADYSIFVAEVASTFNEILLFHDYLESIKDENIRLNLLMEYLDGIKGSVFRQTQFAEFELRIHEMAERGEQLTGDSLSELYKEVVRAYYGHDKGICYVDDIINVEWAYIPHFYYNFYVYQYSTSWTAATALSEKVRNNEKGVLKKYINFISSGGSDYPISLLKKAGVDMTTAEPFNKTMKEMNWAMDEIEKILAKNGL